MSRVSPRGPFCPPVGAWATPSDDPRGIADAEAVFVVLRNARVTYGLDGYGPHVMAWAMHYEGRCLSAGPAPTPTEDDGRDRVTEDPRRAQQPCVSHA